MYVKVLHAPHNFLHITKVYNRQAKQAARCDAYDATLIIHATTPILHTMSC
ncbi:hypothetical protein Y038_5974 [Burkholderia pseudomallei MSHR543]|nr:hypothetical protein Y038_5974 [Burkholderia pseudomallei MSHR543]